MSLQKGEEDIKQGEEDTKILKDEDNTDDNFILQKNNKTRIAIIIIAIVLVIIVAGIIISGAFLDN